MTMLLAFGLLLGALLGLRFGVYVLILTIPVILAFLVVGGLARGGDLWSLAASAGLAVVGIQLGYLCATGALFFLSWTHAHEPSASTRFETTSSLKPMRRMRAE